MISLLSLTSPLKYLQEAQQNQTTPTNLLLTKIERTPPLEKLE